MCSLVVMPHDTALILCLTIYETVLPVCSRVMQRRSLRRSQLAMDCRRQTLLTCE